MHNEIIICDFEDAKTFLQRSPQKYRVISIQDPETTVDLPDAKEVLYLSFYDAYPQDIGYDKLATLDDCRKALDFMHKGDTLVHCLAGVSRSTAMALGYLLHVHKDYRRAVEELYKIRPCAIPNKYILQLMCEIHKMNELHGTIIAYSYEIYRKIRGL